MKRLWHNFRLADLTAMYRSCNDEKMKEKLWMKINYHKEKLGRRIGFFYVNISLSRMEARKESHMRKTIKLILAAVALGMGVSVFILSILGNIEVNNAISLLSMGIICLAILKLQEK